MSLLGTPFLVLIGLALFLFGMDRLEAGVRALGYDTFKRWISRSTASPVRSAGLGIVITALLQSSSLVSLLVLAFASAGVLPLYNAVGVILGANLGTTVTGWIVASIGFKLSLAQLALPAMAAGAVLQLLPGGRQWLAGTGRAVFGLGLVLFGLDSMKDAVAELPERWDMNALADFGPWLYFLVGALIAAIVQSSSATMMLTLAALNSGLIELPAAAAVVIGADLGTTSTTALGSLTGHAIKRQLALGHFLFNVVVDVGALVLLLPLLPGLLGLLGLADPLYSLVAFHSIFNLLGLLAFLPVLRPYAAWLGRQFAGEVGPRLSGHAVQVPEAALAASAALVEEMRLDTVVLALQQFHLRPEHLSLPPASATQLEARYDLHLRAPDRYAALKQREAELLRFSLDLQEQALTLDQAQELQVQVREARAMVYSSKSQMDIRENIASLRHADEEELTALYSFHRKFVRKVYGNIMQLGSGAAAAGVAAEQVASLLRANDEHYDEANRQLRALAAARTVSEPGLSSILNVNRDVHHSIKDLLHGRVAD